jgi:hypothetical protein
MTDVFWTELRRSSARWWTLPFGAAIAMYLLASYDRWYAIGSQSGAAIQIGAGLGTVIASAAATWAGVQRSRSDQEDQLAISVMSPWVREALPLLAVLTHLTAPIVLAVGVVSGINAAWGRAGLVWPTFIWLAMVIVLLCISAGYLLGRVLPSPFTVAAASIIMAIVVMAGTDVERFALITLYGYPDLRLSWSALASRVFLCLTVLMVAVGAGAWREWARRRRLNPRSGPAIAAVAMGIGVIAVGFSGPLQVERGYVGGAPCTETYPMVCVWYEHERHLPLMEAYVGRFNELEEFIALPDEQYKGIDEFWEEGMRGDVGDQLTFFGGDFGAASSMVHYAMSASGFPGCRLEVDDDDSTRVGTLEWNLADWFTAYVMEVDSTSEMGVFAPGLDEIDPILAMSEEEQFDWARSSIDAMREYCRD